MPLQRIFEAADPEQTRKRGCCCGLGFKNEGRNRAGHTTALANAWRGCVEHLPDGKKCRALSRVREQRRVAERFGFVGIRVAAQQLEHLPVNGLDYLPELRRVD